MLYICPSSLGPFLRSETARHSAAEWNRKLVSQGTILKAELLYLDKLSKRGAMAGDALKKLARFNHAAQHRHQSSAY